MGHWKSSPLVICFPWVSYLHVRSAASCPRAASGSPATTTTLAGGGQPARRPHDVWSDIHRFVNGRRPIRPRPQGPGDVGCTPLKTKEIVRQACPCVSNHVPETNFPLKNLDGPPQGVKLPIGRDLQRSVSRPIPVFARRLRCSAD